MISEYVSVLVTSRDERDIRMGMEHHMRYCKTSLPPNDISSEIRDFVPKEVKDCIVKNSLIVRDQGLVQEITRQLALRSAGM